MNRPIVARPSPYLVPLRAGKTYLWCQCGRSARQPYCDGSHRGTGIEPIKHVATVDGEEVLFCGCKQTGTAPFCDGAHTNLPGGSPLDDPDSPANRAVEWVRERTGPRTSLDGNCFVVASSLALAQVRPGLRFGHLISQEHGSSFYTQAVLEVGSRGGVPLAFGDRHVILFIASGHGEVVISGRPFAVEPTTGVYIRPDEVFQISPAQGSILKVFALASPPGEITWPQRMPDNFDAQFPERVVSWDEARAKATGPRHYQCLVDKRLGSTVLTQFIGHIPRSKSAAHRHLYEEALIILSGEGVMWTESRKCHVGAGDVIYLPRKQLHSLEATSSEGLEVVGVISPGDNPSVNYFDE